MAYDREHGAPQAHISSDTEKGVKYFSWSILLFICNLIAFGVAIGSYALSCEECQSVPVRALAALLTAGFGAVILAFAFIILGIIQFNHGKNEFSGKHPRSVTLGTLCFILPIVMYIVYIVLSMVYEPLPAEYWTPAAITAAVIIMLTPIFKGLMYVFMIKDIAQPADKTLLKRGLTLFLVFGILTGILTMVFLLADNYYNTPLLVSIFFVDIIAHILFFIAYWHTKKALATAVSAS